MNELKIFRAEREVRELMLLAVIILTIFLLIAVSKWFLFYCTLLGVLHYYGIKYNYVPNAGELKEITNQATKRVIDDFLKLKS